MALRDVAESETQTGDHAEALEHYRLGTKLAERLVARNPVHVQNRRLLATHCGGSAAALARSGRFREAADARDKAVRITEDLVAADALNVDHGLTLMNLLLVATRIYDRLDEHGKALDLALRGCELGDSLTRDGRTPQARRRLAAFHTAAAEYLVSDHDAEAGLEHLTAAVEIVDVLLEAEPDNVLVLYSLANAQRERATALTDVGRLDDAAAASARDVELVSRWVAQSPEAVTARLSLAFAHSRRACVLEAMGQVDGTLQSWTAAIDVLTPLAAADPNSYEIATNLIHKHLRCGVLLLEHGDAAGARPHFEQAIELAAEWRRGAPGSWLILNNLVNALHRHVEACLQLGETARARESRSRWIEAWDTYAQRPSLTAADLGVFAKQLLACEFEDLRDVPRALAAIDKALQLNGRDDVALLRVLAAAREQSGDVDGAVAALQRARRVAASDEQRAAVAAELARLQPGR